MALINALPAWRRRETAAVVARVSAPVTGGE